MKGACWLLGLLVIACGPEVQVGWPYPYRTGIRLVS